jgi:hypothetical protein
VVRATKIGACAAHARRGGGGRGFRRGAVEDFRAGEPGALMAATEAVGIGRGGGFWCGRGFRRDAVEEEFGAGEPGALMAATEEAARISSRFSWSVETRGGGRGGTVKPCCERPPYPLNTTGNWLKNVGDKPSNLM